VSPPTLDYSDWTGLLADIVTPAGKVDYEALAAQRDRLGGVIAMLAAASPESDPERFPTEEHVLAYWINAYNAFVLDAVIEEYPIRSVWKVRDGQFFERGASPGGRPPPEPQRDRAPHPPRAPSRAAHPLRDQLRLQRLPAHAAPGL
jgi:hypothetical protein